MIHFFPLWSVLYWIEFNQQIRYSFDLKKRMNEEEYFASFSTSVKAHLREQRVTSMDQLLLLGTADLKEFGLKMGDVANLANFRAKRAREEGSSTQQLMEDGLVNDPHALLDLLPKNWHRFNVPGSLRATLNGWKEAFNPNPHIWEEVEHHALIITQIAQTADFPTNMATIVWNRLMVCILKMRFPAHTKIISSLFQEKMIKTSEKESLASPNVQFRLMTELISTLRARPAPTPPTQHQGHTNQTDIKQGGYRNFRKHWMYGRLRHGRP